MGKVLIGNFKGPQGETGAQGAVGPKGEQGIQGPMGPAGGVDRINGGQGDIIFDTRNLLENTNDFVFYGNGEIGGGSGYCKSSCNPVVLENGIHAKKLEFYDFNPDTTSGYRYLILKQWAIGNRLKKSAKYRLSFKAISNMSGTLTVNLNNTESNNYIGSGTNITLIGDEEPHTYTSTVTITANEWRATNYDGVLLGFSKSDSLGYIITYDWQMTEGNVETSWSPATEDYAGPFNIYYTTNMRRDLFRGNCIGYALYDWQKEEIRNGTFNDMYVGDYWSINGHRWRIADFDYWLGKGDTDCTKHHIVVVPDVSLCNAAMNSSNTTEGGYYNSDMRQKNLTQAEEMVETDFGAGFVLDHRIYLTNAVKDGYPSAGAWCDSKVDLMNEYMVYGMPCFSPASSGTIIPHNNTTEHTQLALFQTAPYYIHSSRASYWLRDVISASHFAYVDSGGSSGCLSASGSLGVRPAIGIIGG